MRYHIHQPCDTLLRLDHSRQMLADDVKVPGLHRGNAAVWHRAHQRCRVDAGGRAVSVDGGIDAHAACIFVGCAQVVAKLVRGEAGPGIAKAPRACIGAAIVGAYDNRVARPGGNGCKWNSSSYLIPTAGAYGTRAVLAAKIKFVGPRGLSFGYPGWKRARGCCLLGRTPSGVFSGQIFPYCALLLEPSRQIPIP